jgi:hypothetical protein
MNSRDITQLHHDIRNLVQVSQQTDLALAKCLAAMACDRRYRDCGAASMADYIRHHVTVGEGKAHGLLAIGRKLTTLPLTQPAPGAKPRQSRRTHFIA